MCLERGGTGAAWLVQPDAAHAQEISGGKTAASRNIQEKVYLPPSFPSAGLGIDIDSSLGTQII